MELNDFMTKIIELQSICLREDLDLNILTNIAY